MKAKKILLCGAALLAFAIGAAQAVTIDITGATAFRSAAINTIIAAYGAGLTDVAHNGAAAGGYTGATQSIFRGNFPGIGADTIIRCTWTGSVEGIRDLAIPQTQNFLTTAAFSAGTSATGPSGSNERFGVPAGTDPALPKFAFSDVFPSSSPYDVSNLTATTVGVITFVMVANEGAPAGLTNVTTQQFRALFASGFQPLNYFFPTSDTRNVYATGRNDLSGTRTTYLAEVGYGISNVVAQWKPTVASGTMSALQLWPTGDGANASSVWNGDVAGNGGFSSGGTVATALGATSASVQLKNAAGTNIGSPVPLLVISAVGTSDALTAVNNGAKALSYNGVGITPANPLSAGDVAKITEGAYTLWGYEHLIYKGTLDGNEQAVYDQLTANIAGNLGAAGIDVNLMHVSRDDDGGNVGP